VFLGIGVKLRKEMCENDFQRATNDGDYHIYSKVIKKNEQNDIKKKRRRERDIPMATVVCTNLVKISTFLFCGLLKSENTIFSRKNGTEITRQGDVKVPNAIKCCVKEL